MHDFQIEYRFLCGLPGTVLLTLKGSIDFTTAPRFRQQVEACRAEGARRFILDMDGVTYINSGGLSTLIGLAGAELPEGPGLALLKVPPKIRSLIDLLKLGGTFRYAMTLEDAMEILGRPSSSTHPAVRAASPDAHP